MIFDDEKDENATEVVADPNGDAPTQAEVTEEKEEVTAEEVSE